MPPLRPKSFAIMPRDLLFAWSNWLLGSLLICYFVWPPHRFDYDSVVPFTRWFMVLITVGFCQVWPAIRLSDADQTGHPTLNSIAEALGMMVLTAMVVLTLWLLLRPEWQTRRIGQIAVTLIVWAIPVTLFISIGRRGGYAVKILAMCCCSMVLLSGPIMTYLTGIPRPMLWSPITDIWRLTDADPSIHLADLPMKLLYIGMISSACLILQICLQRPTADPQQAG